MRDVVVVCESELYGWWDLVVVKSAKPCALASYFTPPCIGCGRAKVESDAKFG